MTAQDRSAIANNIQERVNELTFSELATLSDKVKKQELLHHLVGWVPAGDNAICQVNVANYPENLHIHGNFL